MPRLLILCEYPTVLGGERSMLATLPAVAAAGFEICVAAPSTGPLRAMLDARGISFVPWITHDGNVHRRSLNDLRNDLASIIARVDPDLVHANSLSTARIAGPVVGSLNVRSIGHLRDIIKFTESAIADLNQHQMLLAVSQAARNFHVGQGLDQEKCEVLYNGVDLQEFRPRTPTQYLHRELGLPENARLIAVVGQLGLRKATDVALEAARTIIEKFPETHWLIVGERTSGKDESRAFEMKLRQFADVPPLAGNIHFLGNRSDMALLLAECTLLVHAAHQEPLGRVLLEAAASGLAIVATNVGGTPEIFPPGSRAATLVLPNDPTEIANAACLMLSDESRRSACGLAARTRAEEAFDIRNASRALIQKYEEALA